MPAQMQTWMHMQHVLRHVILLFIAMYYKQDREMNVEIQRVYTRPS